MRIDRPRLWALAGLWPNLRDAPIAWAVLAVTLALSVLGWWTVDRLVSERVAERFRAETQRLTATVSDRMQKQEQALAGAKGLFAASSEVSRAEWKAYVDALNLAERYPGLLGLGYSVVIRPDTLDQHTKNVMAEGFPSYAVRPAGPRDIYTSIVFLEPFVGRNLRAFGYDMFSEPTRRAAMERARDTGRPAASGTVTLVQETNKDVQQGFLLYLPIYRNGASIETVAQRRAAHLGFVYSPFRADDLMAGILGKGPENVDLHISDAGALLYDSNRGQSDRHRNQANPLIATTHLVVGGRVWALSFAAKPEFVAASESNEAWIAAGAGAAIGILLFIVVGALSTQHRRAEALVSERTKELEAAYMKLEQSDARSRALVELSSDWWWETNADCVIERITAGNEVTAPVDKSGFVGLRLATTKGPGTSEADWTAHVDKVSARRPFRQHTFRIRGRDGFTRTLSSSAKPIFSEDGAFTGYIGATRDVTLEVNTRTAINDVKRRIVQAMDIAPSGISIVDADGRLVESNSASRDARTRNGQYTEIGKQYAEILHDAIVRGGAEIADDPNVPTGASLYNRLRECGPPFECRLGNHWYLVRSARLADDTLVVGSSDITALKAREREFAEAKAAAETANRYKTEFLATMSHELRNPLTSVMGALSIIIANPGAALPEKVTRLIGVALENSRRLVKLINEVLDVERIEAGLAMLNVAPVKLLDVVRPAIEAMNGLGATRGVKISLDPDSSHETVRGDADRLQQVAINLLSNAIKFSPENGEVTVSVRGMGAKLRLSVADRGPGIPEAFRARIFERFAQAESAAPTKDGSGLGLAIARSIVVQHGGAISFETAEGRGTTFHVDLPLPLPETRGEAA